MSTLAVAVITCDRTQFGKQNTWPRMWESLLKSGFREQLTGEDAFALFDAGPFDRDWAKTCATLVERFQFDRSFQVWHSGRLRIDMVRNTHRAMAWCVATGCDYGIILTDDWICSKNWFPETRRWLDECVPKGGAAYNLISQYPWSRAPNLMQQRWGYFPLEEFYGALPAYSRAVLMEYLFSMDRQRIGEWDVKSDWIPRDIAQRRGMPLYAHCPDLFQHIGDNDSTSGHGFSPGPHKIMFPGEDFDALGTADHLRPWQEEWAEWSKNHAEKEHA